MKSPYNLMDPYRIRIKSARNGRQSDEYFLADINGIERHINLHDYDAMYQHPMLYDIVVYKHLKCATPREIRCALSQVWRDSGVDPGTIRTLEIGAGSGAFGAELRESIGVGYIAGLDIIESAKIASERDRPHVYNDYIVADLTSLTSATHQKLQEAAFSCVAVASATGWGNHIPVNGFENAFSFLSADGWFVFHVKPNDPDPECVALCQWVDGKISDGALNLKYRNAHFHRTNSDNKDIYYDVIIGTKA